MTRRTKGRDLYFNTMIFSIVSALVSCGLLLLLIYGPDEVRAYAVLIITLELGLLSVMISTIARIYAYERSLESASRNARDNITLVDMCPDYWRIDRRGERTKCINGYRAPRTGVEYKTGPASVREIDLTDLSKNRTLEEVCRQVDTVHRDIPWSSLKTRCWSLYDKQGGGDDRR